MKRLWIRTAMSSLYPLLLMIAPMWGQQPMEVQIIPLREIHPNTLESWRQLPPDQRAAAERIEALGGFVSMNHVTGKPPAESISFKGDNFTDAQIPLLHPFKKTQLRGLAFVHTRLTEQGIAELLNNFNDLTILTLCDVTVGDEALVPLQNFSNLKYVTLSQMRLSSLPVRHIACQSQLEHLTLSETEIDDSALNYLRRHSTLKLLFAGKTKITSACLPAIGTLNRLETLALNDTKIGDQEFVHIENLQNLDSLELSQTQITNESMSHIAKLAALRYLNIERTGVNENGLALLKDMPHLRDVRWLDPEKATIEQRRFFAKFILYLPGNMDRWKDLRQRLERGEITIDDLATVQ